MIFVFGSNLSGIHGGGSARAAHLYHGAILGKGEGLQGNSYAIPTVGVRHAQMAFREVEKHVDRFLEFARKHPHLEFQVTRIGTNRAGFTDKQMAALFIDAPQNCLFDEAWRDLLPPTARFWGRY